MGIFVYKDAVVASSAAATMAAAQIIEKPDSIIGLSTETCWEQVYRKLVEFSDSGILDWSDIVTFNIDEYVEIPITQPQTHYSFVMRNLLSKVNIQAENINIPNGNAPELKLECASYDRRLSALGGLDVLFLSAGTNGRIGFNYGGSELIAGTHLVKLNQSESNGDDIQKPELAITAGMNSVMSAKKIIVLMTGGTKADAAYKMLHLPINPMFPASLLQLHRNVTFMFDEAAAIRL